MNRPSAEIAGWSAVPVCVSGASSRSAGETGAGDADLDLVSAQYVLPIVTTTAAAVAIAGHRLRRNKPAPLFAQC